MTADLEFTGERFLPGTPGDIAYEHWHRYAFALRLVAGKRVLDAACGEGYGSALLAGHALSVTGVDIDPVTVERARRVYAGRPGLAYEQASVTALPLAAESVDVVVSFETIEHLPQAEQPAMLAEFARVLAPGGMLVISSPNRKRYSDDRAYQNPFHQHELYREQFAQLLDRHFPSLSWYHQNPFVGSAIWGESRDSTGEAWVGDGTSVGPMPPPDGMYYIVVAARDREALPPSRPGISLFADGDDSELKRAEANAREVMRIDAKLGEALATIDRQAGQVRQLGGDVRRLEQLVAEGERLVTERDRQLQEKLEELRAAEAALAAQERLSDYRSSLKGWLRLPLHMFRRRMSRWFDR